MPLASDRSASLKRAQALEAEKRERKRMRKSLPSTFPSSLSVDEKKTRQSRARRASLQKKESTGLQDENNENVRQGPTPYWKVVQERGGNISPPETRSAKKNKLPPRHETTQGGVMLFSPPDQALNEQNRKEQIQKLESEREKRIQKNRNAGNLLVFSPTHREGSNSLLSPPNRNESENPVDSPKQGDEEEAETCSDLSTSDDSRGNNEQLTQDVRTLCDAVSEIVQSNRKTEKLEKDQQSILLELAATKAKNETLEKVKSHLESTVESLQKEIREVQAQRLSEREDITKEKIRRETEIEVVRVDLRNKISLLNEVKSNYEIKVDQLTKENIAAVARHKELDVKLQSMKHEYLQKKQEMKELSAEHEASKKSIDGERQKILEDNADLRRKHELQTKNGKELQATVEEYEMRIESLEKDILPSKNEKIKEAERTIRAHEETIHKLNDTVNELRIKLAETEKEKFTLKNDFETSNQIWREQNDKLGSTVAKFKAQIASRDDIIRTLEHRISQADTEKNEQNEASTKMSADFESHRSNLSARIEELEQALAKATKMLDDAKKLAENLQNTIKKLEHQLKTQAGSHALIEEKNSMVSRSLDKARELSKRLEGQNREKGSRIAELERELAIKDSENNDLRAHVNEQKTREAALYQRLQTSNEIRRELHAKVMQLMGNIRVFIRVRPVLDGESASPLIRFPGHDGSSGSNDITKKLVEMTEPKRDRGGLSDRRKKWKFAFDEVFDPTASQNQVWNATEPLIQSAIDGFNVTIFAYGQTGSGKTHTLLGDETSNRGIIGRSIEKLFNAKAEIEATSEGRSVVEFSVEMLEVYNEEVRDLLASGFSSDGKLLSLKVNSQEVVGNEVVRVHKDEEILGILGTAQKRRCVKATASNSASSRSHLLFTMNIKITLESGVERVGKLNICDLAGSERLDKSGANIVGGSLLQESKAINKSLSVLSHVIEKLQSGVGTVPFRESKLTFLLRNSLAGDSKTLAIVCCSPVEAHHHETLCSLRFAEKANKVELNKAVAKFSC